MNETADISPAELSRAIRWLEEKLVFVALTLSLISAIVAAVSVTAAIMIIGRASDEMENMSDEMEVYEIYITNLDARLRSMGIEPPPLPEN